MRRSIFLISDTLSITFAPPEVAMSVTAGGPMGLPPGGPGLYIMVPTTATPATLPSLVVPTVVITGAGAVLVQRPARPSAADGAPEGGARRRSSLAVRRASGLSGVPVRRASGFSEAPARRASVKPGADRRGSNASGGSREGRRLSRSVYG